MGVRAVFYMASIFAMASFLIALTLDAIPEARIRSPLIPLKMIIRNREVILPFIMRHATASSIWVLWPLFLKEEIGLSLFQIGLVQATNALTQFGAMFLLGDRISPRKSVGIGLILSSIAVLSFVVVKSFPLFLLTQVILGLSWANLFVGNLRSMLIKNKERATAVGLLNSSISLSALIGPFIALILVEILPQIPYEAPMILAGISAFLAFIYYGFRGIKRVPYN
jgi:sugar phosphate permease